VCITISSIYRHHIPREHVIFDAPPLATVHLIATQSPATTAHVFVLSKPCDPVPEELVAMFVTFIVVETTVAEVIDDTITTNWLVQVALSEFIHKFRIVAGAVMTIPA